jgi:Fe-S cluster biogenesis protein NfuA
VLPGEGNPTMNFPNARAAMSSPLAKELFKIGGVTGFFFFFFAHSLSCLSFFFPPNLSLFYSPTPFFLVLPFYAHIAGVFFASDFITVNKDPEKEWVELKASITTTIMNFYNSGKPIVTEKADLPQDTAIQPEDSEVVMMIKEIIETRVKPGVQEDGGDIVYKGFENGIVFLKIQGSCSGCPSSSVTLKNGIERMLTHWVPEGICLTSLFHSFLCVFLFFFFFFCVCVEVFV